MKNNARRIPARLAQGDTIALIAPASPFDRDKLNRGESVLRSMGFRVFEPSGLFERRGYLAGDDRHRARLLNEVFESPDFDAVMCARGGYGSIRILDLIDYDIIRRNPKVFVGFSDITALLNAFLCRCGLVTFHGPTVTGLADLEPKTEEALFSALTSEKPISIFSEKAVALKPGKARGPVAGGNLTTLCHLTGIARGPRFDGHILFLEDRGEAPYRIDRMLTHMKMAGVFDRIAGMVLGDFSDCGSRVDVLDVFKEHFEKCDFPILAGLEAGHEKCNLVVPFGIEATLNSDDKLLFYHHPSTSERLPESGGRGESKNSFSGSLASDGDYCLPKSMENVNALMRKAVADFVFPCAVLMVSSGDSVLLHRPYGVRNIVANDPATRNTFFDLASLTKPLAVAVSIMALVRDRKLGVEDRIRDFLPGFDCQTKKEIRIEHLLRHSSGLPDYKPYYKKVENGPPETRKKHMRELLTKEDLIFAPGARTLYSDLGFMALEWIVETVSGGELDRYAKENVYGPLGLGDLFFQSSDRKKRRNGEFAATEKCLWRNRILIGEVHDENAAAAGGVQGHAGLFGSAENVHRLLRHLMAIYESRDFKGIFPFELVRTFFRRKENSERALGFDTPSLQGSSSGRLFSFDSVGHLGFTGTSFWMDLKRSILVVLLTNRIHPVRENEKIKKFRPEIHDAIMEAVLKCR